MWWYLRCALKSVTETVKDNTTVASQTGLTINTSRVEYMINIIKDSNEPKKTEINRNSRNFLHIQTRKQELLLAINGTMP